MEKGSQLFNGWPPQLTGTITDREGHVINHLKVEFQQENITTHLKPDKVTGRLKSGLSTLKCIRNRNYVDLHDFDQSLFLNKLWPCRK